MTIWSKTSRAILARLRDGPATNRELQEVACTHSGDIARRMCAFARLGYVKRIDGGQGRGWPAVYALTENANG
jgi:hypothetical protein